MAHSTLDRTVNGTTQQQQASPDGTLLPELLGPAVTATVNYTKPAETALQGLVTKGEKVMEGGGVLGNIVMGTTGSSKGSVKGVGRQLLEPHEMKIYDARPVAEQLSMDRHGVIIAKLRTKLPDSLDVVLDEKETLIKEIYYPELAELAMRNVVLEDGRRPKYAFCNNSQKFTEDKSRGYMGAYSRQAHADMTGPTGPWWPKQKMLRKMVKGKGLDPAEIEEMDTRFDVMFINAWQPFSYPVKDNPLTILDWTSVDVARDIYVIPPGVPLTFGEPVQRILYNPNHRWLYLPEMTPEEVWLFKQGDSRGADPSVSQHVAQHAFHTAVRLPDDDGQARTRRSIAVRMVLLFEKNPAALIAKL